MGVAPQATSGLARELLAHLVACAVFEFVSVRVGSMLLLPPNWVEPSSGRGSRVDQVRVELAPGFCDVH